MSVIALVMVAGNLEARAAEGGVDMHHRASRASAVLIAPQLAEHAQPLIERHALLFPVLSDLHNMVARQYGLVFQS